MGEVALFQSSEVNTLRTPEVSLEGEQNDHKTVTSRKLPSGDF